MVMKIRSKNLGEERWFLIMKSSGPVEDREFKEWMDKHCSECMYVNRFNGGDPYWEVRGGDMRQQTMILLKWSR
jgi:hypothetical protein